MLKIEVRNVNDAYPRLCKMVMEKGDRLETRNGPAMSYPDPVLVHFRQPWERVHWDAERDANPIFHLMEAVWMLAGGNDVAFVAQFNKNMETFSDDGKTFNAAYGHRWASHFGFDQLAHVVQRLREDPNDRQAIVTMWDPADLCKETKDKACNLQMLPRLSRGKLTMTSTNRSNDLIWGLCGANAVHLSFMHEWMAAALGVTCGMWHHLTNNLHIYERHWDLAKNAETYPHWTGWPGTQPLVSGTPIEGCPPGIDLKQQLMWNADVFREECRQILEGKTDGFRSPFLEETVEPVWASWREWKAGDKSEALDIARSIEANDWRRAVVAWYKRRM